MTRWQSEEPNDLPDEEEELDEGEWELDPNDPSHLDHDLSEGAGYAGWDPMPKPWYVRRGVMLAVAVLVILALVILPVIRIV